MKKPLRVCAAADLHGNTLALCVVGGIAKEYEADIILLAGDLTVHSIYNSWLNLLTKTSKYAKCPIVCVLGNHDNLSPSKYFPESRKVIAGTLPLGPGSVVCLTEESVSYKGFNIWGSPFTLPVARQRDWYWQRPVTELKFPIPQHTDICITHQPPWGYGDRISTGKHIGSEALTIAIENTPNLKLCIFGHNHEDYGWSGRLNGVTLVNVSCHTEKLHFMREGIKIIDIQGSIAEPQTIRP